MVSKSCLATLGSANSFGIWVCALTLKGKSVCSLGSTGGGYCVWLFHIMQKYFVQQHSFLCSNIQHSTFPHQPKAGGPSSLSREGNLRAPAPINSNLFREITLFIFSSILISSSKNVYLLFYAIPRRIVNSQKLYRTKALKWTRLPFLWKFCKFLKQKICSQHDMYPLSWTHKSKY